MWKKLIALVVLSIIVIVAMPYAQRTIQLLINAHDHVSQLLTNIFAGREVGNVLRGLFALLIIPLVTGLVPSAIYWLVRKTWFPYFMDIVWVMWLVQTGALLAIYNVGG